MSTASMAAVSGLRPHILERRARLQAAAGTVSDAYLNDLLAEIDAALRRMDEGSYGLCDTCHDPIEPDRLQRDPMERFCLDHLSPEQLKAHQQDLDLATEIQSKLLPRRDLVVAEWDVYYRYEPVGAVGGDYCEIIPLDDEGSFFFAVGDVAGKGVAASLLMTHLNAIFRSLLSLQLPLEEVMSRANRLFCEGTADGHYATLACGRTTADGIEVCNAGHCAPLLLRRDGTQRVESTGLPIGLFCGVQYEVRTLPLAQGDALVLYSDGITEGLDPEGNDYGEERVMHSARNRFLDSAEEMAAGVLRDFAGFRKSRAAVDDVTLLVVRRR